MINEREAEAMAEVLHYLKGIRQEDIEKIPKSFMHYLNQNASKDYKCYFDFERPLNELPILPETRGLIGMICYNYWCEDEEQKKQYLKHLGENEKAYQEELRKKYNLDVFKQSYENKKIDTSETKIAKYKEDSFFKKIFEKIKYLLQK